MPLQGIHPGLDQVLDHLIEGFQIVDTDWRYLYVNEAVTGHAGRSREQLLGRTMFDCYPGFENTELFQRLRRCMNERVADALDHEFTYPDGTKRWFDLRIRPVPQGLCILSLEITGCRRSENQLESLVRELERSNGELQSFAYVVSHDLQEPLRTVAGFTELLVRRYRGQLDTEAEEFLQFIDDGVRRMQALLRDLLLYSRAGGQLDLQAVDLGQAVHDVLLDLRSAIEESGARMECDSLPNVTVDPHKIHQVFLNLIGNAIKYRSAEPPAIAIHARHEGEDWIVSISDNGIGFDMHHAERIFRVFQRLHARDQYSGTGIGLAVCKRIIERHGGRIWADSAPGKGSTFRFTIPDRRDR